MSDTPDFERFAYEWSNGTTTKLAIGVEYDGQLIARFKSLDWKQTHRSFEPDYQFLPESNRERKAWTFDADRTTLKTLRERTTLRIPPVDECPINPRPFPDGTSAIPISKLSLDALSRTCSRSDCQQDSICSIWEFLGVYKKPLDLPTELLVDETHESTHICMSCKQLFVVPRDDRSPIDRAMGAPP